MTLKVIRLIYQEQKVSQLCKAVCSVFAKHRDDIRRLKLDHVMFWCVTLVKPVTNECQITDDEIQ